MIEIEEMNLEDFLQYVKVAKNEKGLSENQRRRIQMQAARLICSHGLGAGDEVVGVGLILESIIDDFGVGRK